MSSLRSSISDTAKGIRRRLSGGPPPDASLLIDADSAATLASPGASRRKATNQFTDSSTLASSEFNDDPQWRMVFLDNYDRLVKQASEHDGLTELVYGFDEYEETNPGSLLAMLTSAVGDLASVTIPITYMEPTSFLQRLAEAFQNSELLDMAADEKDEFKRLAYIATFFASGHCNNVRTLKPFNPLLGETFEYVRTGSHPFKFIAEQVSHHPPIAATHTHNDKWELWDEKRFTSKFGGNSLAMNVLGTVHLFLKTTKERFTWTPVNCTAHNVIVGTTWVEHHGATQVRNLTTGARALVEMTAASWLGRGKWQCAIKVVDADDEEKALVDGKWNESLAMRAPADAEPVVVWSAPPHPPHAFDFWPFTVELCRIDDVRSLEPTDSRLRPDRLLLMQANTRAAGGAKKALEQKQREAKKLREAASGGEHRWLPRFFVPSSPSADDPNEWQFNGRYWDMREARLRRAGATTSTSATTSPSKASESKSPRRAKKSADADGKSAKGTPSGHDDDDNDDGDDGDAAADANATTPSKSTTRSAATSPSADDGGGGDDSDNDDHEPTSPTNGADGKSSKKKKTRRVKK